MSVKIRDARRLSPEAQEDLRRRVVALVQGGMSQVRAAEAFNVSTTSVNTWVNAFRRQGDRALVSGRRGRRPEEQKALSKAQQKTICRTIVAQSPQQAGARGCCGPGRRWRR